MTHFQNHLVVFLLLLPLIQIALRSIIDLEFHCVGISGNCPLCHQKKNK
ncbi:MAG: hypothetical protein IJ605_06895 [Prevotella sp.]|nr:hypothetical protein [Prevotella sp.]